MPLDPRIILGGAQVQAPSPLETLQTFAQIQNVREQTEARRLAADATRKKYEQQALLGKAVRAAYDTKTGSVDAVKLIAAMPDELMPEVLTQLNTLQEGVLSKQEKTMALAMTRQKYMSNVGQQLVAAQGHPNLPSLYSDALRRAHQDQAIDDTTLATLSHVNDPAQILALAQGFVQGGEKEKPQLVETVDEQGRTVKKFVIPTAGESYPQPPKETSPQLVETVDAQGRTIKKFVDPKVGEAYVQPRPQGPQPQLVETVDEQGRTIKKFVVPTVGASYVQPTKPGEEGGIKLTATQQEAIETMMTVEQMAGEVATLGADTKWAGVGPVEGRIGATMFGSGGAKGETLRSKIGNIQGTIAKLRGGTSFTPNEQALLDTYTPTTTDTETKITAKLASLVDFIQKKRENTLRVARGEYTLPNTTPGGGGDTALTVKAPNGKTYTFATAAQAAAFKKRAGIP